MTPNPNPSGECRLYSSPVCVGCFVKINLFFFYPANYYTVFFMSTDNSGICQLSSLLIPKQ